MKSILRMAGLALLLGGVAVACYYFFYFDISVRAPDILGGGRVSNLSLMSQRENGIVFSFGAAIFGCVLIYLGRDSTKGVAASDRKCPYCAELIKVEAKICRHCGKDLVGNS